MNQLQKFVLALLLLSAFSASAQSSVDDCALARDPSRCEARQAALLSCADRYGANKRKCLEAALPAVDCDKAKNPPSCFSAQNAKAACKGKTSKELRQCLRNENPEKKKPRIKAKVKKA